ncbi:MAG: nuclear transport factor 2 family protein [Colwellia sp.]|nr:nuclear transport factor 2 family protein [Colwellia sp.]MCW9083052.1 nuclear transport factor 2 family protein [Colwellia sp.]
MFKLFSMLAILVSTTTLANDDKFDYDDFVKQYHQAMTNTQKPNASKDDLEHYLSYLTDDVGNQHFPNAPDDSREPDGKKLMRKGMSRYLGVHTDYEAKIIDYIVGYNSVAIKHTFSAKGLRSDGSEFSYSKEVLDVLELENGKVSVIRRYGK